MHVLHGPCVAYHAAAQSGRKLIELIQIQPANPHAQATSQAAHSEQQCDLLKLRQDERTELVLLGCLTMCR